MSQMAKIARPYAKGIYAYAKDHQQIQQWHTTLVCLSECVQQKSVSDLISMPGVKSSEVIEWLMGTVADCQGTTGQTLSNFLSLLVEHNRLLLLPMICDQYLMYQAQDNQVKPARLVFAHPASDQQVDQLCDRLQKRYHCQIDPQVSHDPSLLGGVLIEMGDIVIDGSLKGRLAQLQEQLLA